MILSHTPSYSCKSNKKRKEKKRNINNNLAVLPSHDTTTLIKMYMIAPKKGTPKLSGFLMNNHYSLACTTHNGAQHRVYTKKDIQNNI